MIAVTVDYQSSILFVTDSTPEEVMDDDKAVAGFGRSIAIVTGTDSDQVTVLGASRAARRNLLAEELDLSYIISFDLQGTPVAKVAEAQAAVMTTVSAQLTAAISSGSYAAALFTALIDEGESFARFGLVEKTASVASVAAAVVTLKSDGHADAHSDSRADVQTDGRSDAHADGRADVQTDGRSDAQSDGRADVQTDGREDVQTDGRADAKADDRIDSCYAQSDGSADVQTDGRADAQSDGHVDAQSDGHADVQSDGCTDAKSDDRIDTSYAQSGDR
ncbi:hypothetical protein M885DRAFT_577748, partial [Pelagophyceae sp. CCMP2097]